MEWKIVADSSCDLMDADARTAEIGYESVPFVIRVGEKEFVDDLALDVPVLVAAMEHEGGPGQTACPGPDAWMKALGDAENCVVLTISEALSGSHSSASLAARTLREEAPGRKISVIDTRSAGPALVLALRRVQALIAQGLPFEEIEARAEKLSESIHTVFALCSFKNLVRSGRMSRLAGLIAGKLGIWGIGVGDMGRIRVKDRVRGVNRVLGAILQDMKGHGFAGTEVVISHCLNLPLAERLGGMIRETWAGAEVSILPTRGLCSYYAEQGGMIVAY